MKFYEHDDWNLECKVVIHNYEETTKLTILKY
jgi:hypothetical protein